MSEPTTTDLPVDEPVEHADEPQTFDAEYVKGLREEAAQRRTEAKSATERGDALYEQLLTRTIEQAASSILYDPTDLPRDGDYVDDNGLIDFDKVRAAAEDLAVRKPHLSRPNGDTRQGVRGAGEQYESLAAIARRGL